MAACSHQTASESGFRAGATQEEVVKQVNELKGKILKQTTNEILAEVNPPDIQGPVQVQLTFVDGALDQVYYLPRRQ